MSLDRRSWVRVAWAIGCLIGGAAAGGLGCRPAVPPAAPLDEPVPRDQPTVVAPRNPADVPTGPGRRILVGEMCPQGVAGRPGVAPLLLRGVQWTDEPTEVGNAISRGEGAKFLVFGVDGKRAGLFDPVGPADVGLPQMVAAGSYTGEGPCTKVAASGARVEEPTCQAATKGCGIAVAVLEDGAVGSGKEGGSGGGGAAWKIGGACVSGDELAVDLDGDGQAEAFGVASFLDGLRAPAETVEARAKVGATCAPAFTVFGMKIAPPPEPGKAADARYVVMLDVLAVVDFDDDGKREVVLGVRYPDSRTIAVYSGVDGDGDGAMGLKLIGEATSWAK